MCETNIQLLRACIPSCGKIILFLRVTQLLPLYVFLLVPLDVVQLGKSEQHNIGRGNANKDLVATVVYCIAAVSTAGIDGGKSETYSMAYRYCDIY
jgi:hypothetical protein